MKSIRTEASIHGDRGDERIRTAVPGGTNDPAYDAICELYEPGVAAYLAWLDSLAVVEGRA